MSTQSRAIVAFNRGVVSALGLGRVDLDRMRMSAETMTNWMPRVLGSMMLRPGWEYVYGAKGNNQAVNLPFVYAADDHAMIEFTNTVMRLSISDTILTRTTVSAAVTNGAFTSNVTGWTDSDEAGGASAWATGGYLALLGDGTNAAIRDQQVSVTETGTEHALRINIQRGDVYLRVGSSSGDDDYISETALGTGEHSLAFTPTGNFHIRFFSRSKSTVLVDSVAVESNADVEFTAPYATASLRKIRYAQSGDVIYLACDGYQQYKVERRGTRSWSLVKYEPKTGPFRNINTSSITMAPGAISGDVTITASKAFFKSTHVGSLIRIGSIGQEVSAAVTAEDTFTDPIRVVGNGDSRKFNYTISGSFTATVTIQYSIGEPGAWVDRSTTYSGATSGSITDGFDGQVIYYRIGVKSGDFSSGTATCSLDFASGSIEGVARITAYSSSTSVSAVTLTDFGGTDASKDWWEGEWSDLRGYPTAVVLHEGRLTWAGRSKIFHSISDAYEDFDDAFEGDAGPISRSIGEGPVDEIHWLTSLGNLFMGTAATAANVQSGLISRNNPPEVRSSYLGEPLTPTNYNIKNAAAKGLYVDSSAQRLYEISFQAGNPSGAGAFGTEDLTILAPDYNSSGIVHVAVQMKPDVRIHCVRSDGTVGILVYDRVENVICWCEVTTDGTVEDVCVFPGSDEDTVYYTVNRTIGGSTVRYVEKWAQEDECIGGNLNKQADSFVTYESTATTTPFTTELLHLAAETVVIWADGVYVGTDTVTAGGALTSALATAASNVVVGLTYTAQFKSAKQAELANLVQKGDIPRVGLILYKTHAQGLEVGMDFDNLYNLPLVRDGATVDTDSILDTADDESFPINATNTTDPRICLQATAPKPCTVVAATFPLRKGMAA